MYVHKPRFNIICEQIIDSEPERQLEIYRECIAFIDTFREYYPEQLKFDLFTLASFRIVITASSRLEEDTLFYKLANIAQLSKEEWRELTKLFPANSLLEKMHANERLEGDIVS
jgi:hypothetical protein